MSKINAIRKKALECVRKQNWEGAVKEYKRLADLDQSNPNVFNELGDIYLKLGNKSDAYDGFARAIDAYTRVSLYNNAVAVCKKVLRLIPTRIDILIKLGMIRKKQGLSKEAESYYLSYLEKVVTEQTVSPADVGRSCGEIVDDMGDSLVVLEKVYDCQIKFNLKTEAGHVLQKLYKAYKSQGLQEGVEKTRARMDEAGVNFLSESEPQVGKDGVIITENNIWSAGAHSDGERIDVTRTPGSTGEKATEEPVTAAGSKPAPAANKSVFEYGDVDVRASEKENQTTTSTQTIAPPPPDPVPSPEIKEEEKKLVNDVTPEPEAPPQAEATPAAPAAGGKNEAVHVSAIIDEYASDEGDSLSEDDYRSHYDLGMAYLEMDLLPEAIREYQMAAKSPNYQIRSLEMIGLCFLKRNQAGLAIKQLTKGLAIIGGDDRESLGIKYNLGLAYEMVGDTEKAKEAFEDVYVEDVTFREVAEKLAKYS